MGKRKKKKRGGVGGGIFGKAPHCAGVGIPFFVGILHFKMPTNQTANQKEKQCWVNVPSNYTKNKFGAGVEEEVEASSSTCNSNVKLEYLLNLQHTGWSTSPKGGTKNQSGAVSCVASSIRQAAPQGTRSSGFGVLWV